MIKVGEKYHRLTVKKRLPTDLTRKSCAARFVCLCECGRKLEVFGDSVGRGLTKSCGCLYKETRGKQAYKHGLCKHPLYKRWKSMMERCYVKSQHAYGDYGGRGIFVEKRWHNPVSFYKDNIATFDPNLELDRIDNNKGYSRKNCRWATRKQQCRNTRKTVYLTKNGVTLPLREWSDTTGIKPTTITSRIRLGWSEEKALTV